VKKATKEMDPVRFKRRRKIWILLVVQQAPQTEFADHTISTTPQINQQTTVHINQSIHTGRVTLSECNSSACQSIEKKEFPLISFGYFSSTFFTVVRPNSTFPPTNTVKTRREEIKRSPTKTVKTRRGGKKGQDFSCITHVYQCPCCISIQDQGQIKRNIWSFCIIMMRKHRRSAWQAHIPPRSCPAEKYTAQDCSGNGPHGAMTRSRKPSPRAQLSADPR
jgi:hypothetical protein